MVVDLARASHLVEPARIGNGRENECEDQAKHENHRLTVAPSSAKGARPSRLDSPQRSQPGQITIEGLLGQISRPVNVWPGTYSGVTASSTSAPRISAAEALPQTLGSKPFRARSA